MEVLTQFPLLKALGWALFNSLWQMAFLWLLYNLLTSIFSTSAARIRHGLALVLLSIGTAWSGITFFNAWLLPDNSAQTTWLLFMSPAQSAAGWFWQTSRTVMDGVLSYGSTLYLLVLCGLLVRYSNHYWHSRKLTRQGLSTMPPEFRTFVTATGYQLGIKTPVRTWLSSLVDVPLTLGFLKPVILLPVAMINHLTPQQVEAILVHELAHIRRKDYLLHLAVTLLEGLFFFNPFSRLLISQLKKEREHCCDDLVLQFKYDPRAYVSALLSLATRSQSGQPIALAATGDGNQLLLQRARRILLQKRRRQRPGTRFLLLLFFALLVIAATLYPSLHPGDRRQAKMQRGAIPTPITTAPPTLITTAPVAVIATASPREISLTSGMGTTLLTPRPIASIRPIPAMAAHARRPAHRLTRPADADNDLIQAEDNNVFINTAGDDDLTSAGAPTGQGASVPAGDGTSSGEGASTGDNKSDDGPGPDYSLDVPVTIAGPVGSFRQDGTPFVPNSSFSFQYMVDDSSRPAEELEKLIYLQQSGRQEILTAMIKLNQQLATQLKALSALQIKAQESVQLRQQLRARQLLLQQDYLRKMTIWQKKLEKTTHFKMIVYI
jgi:beta-lactamase regulating signal transducer with metallopeptidase domain